MGALCIMSFLLGVCWVCRGACRAVCRVCALGVVVVVFMHAWSWPSIVLCTSCARDVVLCLCRRLACAFVRFAIYACSSWCIFMCGFCAVLLWDDLWVGVAIHS